MAARPARFAGPAYILVQTDADDQLDEYPREAINVQAKGIRVQPIPPSDLVSSGVVAPDQEFDGATITVSYRVSNLGADRTNRDAWTDTIWLTRDQNKPSPGRVNASGQFIREDYLLGTFSHQGLLGRSESYDNRVQVQLTGIRWLLRQAFL